MISTYNFLLWYSIVLLFFNSTRHCVLTPYCTYTVMSCHDVTMLEFNIKGINSIRELVSLSAADSTPIDH